MSGPAATRAPSTSVGDYVKAIWALAGAGAASTKDVADRLSISSASVSAMFGRLQEMGLVRYRRYHGASLTEEGLAEALRLVRRHRLIETFLMEHLGYPWGEVHDEAEMEVAAQSAAQVVGVNNRNLSTFETKLDVTERLAAHAPAGVVLVSESGIYTREDVRRVRAAGAGAVLVGSSIVSAADPAAKIRELIG